MIKDLVIYIFGFRILDGLVDVYDKIFVGYYKDIVIDYDMIDLLIEFKFV